MKKQDGVCRKLQFIIIENLKRNPHVRKCFVPFMNEIRKVKYKKYIKSIYSQQIAELKNKYLNEECFIVGNGPSLTTKDLELLKDKYSFAANMIYSLFDKTVWRPTFYVCIDRDGYKLLGDKLKDIDGKKLFYDISAKRYIKQPVSKNLYYMFVDTNFVAIPGANMHPYVSEDISQKVSDGKTVTFISIQLAIYMGFKKIYLIGVDHNYARKIDKNGKVTFDPNQKDYAEGIKDSGLGIQNTDTVEEAYRQAKKYCETHDVKIYNATRGGKLEVFERVDFDKVMNLITEGKRHRL